MTENEILDVVRLETEKVWNQLVLDISKFGYAADITCRSRIAWITLYGLCEKLDIEHI